MEHWTDNSRAAHREARKNERAMRGPKHRESVATPDDMKRRFRWELLRTLAHLAKGRITGQENWYLTHRSGGHDVVAHARGRK